jgi:hypothetical protein
MSGYAKQILNIPGLLEKQDSPVVRMTLYSLHKLSQSSYSALNVGSDKNFDISIQAIMVP